MTWVPVVDLADANAPDAIDEACTRAGFLTITGHGVADDVMRGAWEAAGAFFALADAAKAEVRMPPGGPYGWSPVEAETLSRSLGVVSLPDLKESLAIGPVDPPTHPFTDPDEASAWSENLWPSALPGLRPAWERYYRELAGLAARLLSVMATALELPSDHFAPFIDRHTSAMRAVHYPAVHVPSVTAGPGRLGASAHTDYGTLTILLADPDQGGLQVQAPDGEWHDVDAMRGSFVVNLGDAMARWTNDRWRSTMHRVLAPPAPRRSIAFFHNANWDALIDCLPTCLAPGEAPRHAPIAAGPHLMQKFRATVNAP